MKITTIKGRLVLVASLLISWSSVSIADTGFILLGDSGTGKDPQFKVAESIKQTCAVNQCDFALGLGDNIYEVGPWSTKA